MIAMKIVSVCVCITAASHGALKILYRCNMWINAGEVSGVLPNLCSFQVNSTEVKYTALLMRTLN